DIKPGMKGYGLTVFEGTQPEKFAVEIIDVLRNFRPRQDLVLIKTTHPRLEVAKIVAGMSGSPIYVDGKMIGAYAYGWNFCAEPIAGVIAIGNMIDELERPLPYFVHGWHSRVGGRGPDQIRAALPMSHQVLRYVDAPTGYDLPKHLD